MDFLNGAHNLAPKLTELYRELHRIPELDRDLPLTKARIEREVERLGLTARPCADGLLVMMPGGDEPGLAVRADMDALPVREDTGTAWASTHEGRMHACGHDGHMAMALGTLALLRDAALPGPLTICFQPAEETTGGAAPMIAAGALEGCGLAIALHLAPWLSTGTLGVGRGAMMASSDMLTIEVIGRGGHGAAPQEAIDPIVAACRIVEALQTVASRVCAPTESVVVTIGRFRAGEAGNVIPERAELAGTVRTLSPTTRARARAAIETLVRGTAEGAGAGAEIAFVESYPATINDRRLAERIADLAGRAGLTAVEPDTPSMTCDDFAYFAQTVPACYALLGCRDDTRPFEPLHSPRFVPDEACLPLGTALLAEMAMAPRRLD